MNYIIILIKIQSESFFVPVSVVIFKYFSIQGKFYKN
jgi:hypothetical protein